ncbi:MAG TPA: cupin domain-containing protein [Geminicoccus sp.]|jgi:quercetin dioxygenase-like cupin family protein|uniref:cupin domain-containing protein n=1 Tax=Geminicoccus sp. TaxID=2024832 RepID=UPI002E32BFF6|nr:cupin domain-containing protein [Geminicoccus sp.]HEX2525896.1 cupin domain-containing protein [Geminicoccus sp.]
MRPVFRLSWIMSAGLLAACTAAAPADGPPVVVNELASETTTASGQPIRLPQGDARILLSEYMIAPGAKLPVHKHPFTRLAYVQAGTLSVTNTDTGQTVVYTPGDLVVEAVDQWHFGENVGTTPVELLVLDELVGDGPATVLKK